MSRGRKERVKDIHNTQQYRRKVDQLEVFERYYMTIHKGPGAITLRRCLGTHRH